MEYSTGIEGNLYKFNYIIMRKRTTLLLKSFFRASVSLFFIFYTLTPSVLATEDVFFKEDQSVSSTVEDTKGEITKEAVSDPSNIVEQGKSTSASKSGPYSIASTSGIWTEAIGTEYHTGLNTKEIRWGLRKCVKVDFWGECKEWKTACDGGQCSGLGFDGRGIQNFNANDKFLLGDLTHFNWPVDYAVNSAKLKITLNFTNPANHSKTFTYDFKIEETDNTKKVKRL